MIVAAGVVLGLVFLASGVLKISAPRQWRRQASELGVPGVVATFVPLAELVVGALLVAQVARRPVALIAAVLLLSFTALLVMHLAQGRRPPCACFGTLSARPIGWGNVVRNAVFVVLAVVVWAG